MRPLMWGQNSPIRVSGWCARGMRVIVRNLFANGGHVLIRGVALD